MQFLELNHVLLIDDDTINNYINEKLLKKLNFSQDIKILLNGEEAIKYLQSQVDSDPDFFPELILLDINMPVMDGFEFLEAFKELNFKNKSQITIIMLTTSTNPSDVTRVKSSIVADYINKPLTEIKLQNMMNKFFS
ncbi:MAG: two-component system response regulator [Cytophagaceae bacterium]